MKRIAITGGAGQISYSLLFKIARGELWNEPLALHILEVESALGALEGVKMELEDCAFPLLREVISGSDPYKVFQDVDVAFLIGAKPRTLGMERKDLLRENGKIFVDQGKALDSVACKEVKILVVGNPCNTNAWIVRQFAKRIKKSNVFAMTRLDQNRATSFLAAKAGALVQEVEDVFIWGNHSSTQVPDFTHAKIAGKKADEVIDRVWLEEVFVEKVQKRGGKVIEARGKSSAESAAHAALGAMKTILFPQDKMFSMGVYSEGNPYGVDPDLIFSFPCQNKDGIVTIASGFHLDPFLKSKIVLSEKELQEEKQAVREGL